MNDIETALSLRIIRVRSSEKNWAHLLNANFWVSYFFGGSECYKLIRCYKIELMEHDNIRIVLDFVAFVSSRVLRVFLQEKNWTPLLNANFRVPYFWGGSECYKLIRCCKIRVILRGHGSWSVDICSTEQYRISVVEDHGRRQRWTQTPVRVFGSVHKSWNVKQSCVVNKN